MRRLRVEAVLCTLSILAVTCAACDRCASQNVAARAHLHVPARRQLDDTGSDGVYAFGYNVNDQLGTGIGIDVTTPTIVPGLANIVAISNSAHSTFALDSSGIVWSWGGTNEVGQLGNGTTTPSAVPTPVEGLTNVVAIATGKVGYYPGGPYSTMSAACLALCSDGTVWAWGNNADGQLGNGVADVNPHPVPTQVTGLYDIVAIAGCDSFCMALRQDGTVWEWGDNTYGEAGNGTADYGSITAPAQVPGLPNTVAITGGGINNYDGFIDDDGFTDIWFPAYLARATVLTQDGVVLHWGWNQSNSYDTTPQTMPGLADVVAINHGTLFDLAIEADETVWAWGDQTFGELGNGVYDQDIQPFAAPGFPISPVPVQVLDTSDPSGYFHAISVSGGVFHTLAVASDNTLAAWGATSGGECGELIGNYAIPTVYHVPGTSNVVAVAGGYFTSVALTSVQATVSGAVRLQSAVNPVQLLTFTLTPKGGGTPTTLTAPVAPQGQFQLINVPAGSYTLSVKGSRWLQTDASIDVPATGLTGVNVSLIPGDANGDNVIDIADFSLLAAAFGSAEGDPTWNVNVDFNCDGVIDIIDFSILAANFGMAGDP